MKRLIACCDGILHVLFSNTKGTWKASYKGQPSNVALLSRAIKPHTANPQIQQVVYYQAGVGTSNGSFLGRLRGGLFGDGLSENVRDAYLYICLNWSEGDEIYLFGFSRGAYTARALGGLISEFGLLTKEGTDGWAKLYHHYRKNKFTVRQEFKDAFNRDYPNGCQEKVNIKFIGVWDTVGSLGVPQLYLFGMNLVPLNWLLNYWRDAKQFGRLALNEMRPQFSPTLWKKKPENEYTKILSQVWFPGVHCSIGGGETCPDLSNITLAWMVQKLSETTGLECDLDYLERLLANRRDPWAIGPWEESCRGIYRLGGRVPRTPGKYKNYPLKETNETVHTSVRKRKAHLNDAYKIPDLTDLQTDDFGAVESKLMGKDARKFLLSTE